MTARPRSVSEARATFFGRIVRTTPRGGVLFYIADGEGLGSLTRAVGHSFWLPRRMVYIFGDRDGRTVLNVPCSMIEERLAEQRSHRSWREMPAEDEECA
jgi:hypothetical protein